MRRELEVGAQLRRRGDGPRTARGEALARRLSGALRLAALRLAALRGLLIDEQELVREPLEVAIEVTADDVAEQRFEPAPEL
ncbi:MAG: hypothetical protein ACYCU0_03275, partial [Solirubrobacteraceae bacterium]